MSFLLDGRKVKRDELEQQIKNYLESLPDYERWRDFFLSSVGNTIVSIMTALVEVLIYKLDVASLDAYLLSSITKEAAYLGASSLGYNPNRKHHATGKVKFIPTVVPQTDIVIPKYTEILGQNNLPFVLDEDVLIPSGSSNGEEGKVIQGEWITETYVSNGEDFQEIIFGENFEVSQDTIKVRAGGQDLIVYDKPKKLSSNTVLVRTNKDGTCSLIFGANLTNTILYYSPVSEQIEITYLKTKGLLDYPVYVNTRLQSVIISGIKFNIEVTEEIKGGSNEDEIEKLKVVAPLFYQSRGNIVTKEDLRAFLLSYPGIISASVYPTRQCCLVKVSCIKQDHLSFNQTEIDDILSYVYDYSIPSLLIEFENPQEVNFSINVDVYLKDFFDDPNNLSNLIKERIQKDYDYKLEKSFNKDILEADIISWLSQNGFKVDKIIVTADSNEVNLEFNHYFKTNVNVNIIV